MNKEDYVSLETAKKLKEKGFNEYCEAYYHLNTDKDSTEEECFEIAPNKDFKNSNNKYRVGAPTLYKAQNWLIERGYFIQVEAHKEPISFSRLIWTFSIIDLRNGDIVSWKLYSRIPQSFNNMQEALDAGISSALNLIMLAA